MQKFSVISINETSGQTVVFHVLADNSLNAFASAAAMNDNLTLVVALPGWLQEDKELFFPGESTVDSETVLEQPDVFGHPVCTVTAEAVTNVLRAFSLRVSNTQGRSFEDMARNLVEDLDATEIISNAFSKLPADPGAIACEQALFDEIHAALVKQGTIEF